MKQKIERPYEKDKFFKKWLVGLSERTKENYTQEFDAWYVFVGMTPTEQIEKRLEDLTSENLDNRPVMLNFEDDCPTAVGTIAWMQDDIGGGAPHQLLNGTITLQPSQEIGTDGTAPSTDQIRIKFTANPTALAGDYNFNIYVHAEDVP
jgi:hypothetical protein